MISGALFFSLLIGFSVATPLRRQDGDGKFGYEYDVKHPGGNSRVHVRAGGGRHGNSNTADYISDATYVNPHYVEPHYQPNVYQHYPTSYNNVPLRGKVPVYEEQPRYRKPPVYQQFPPSHHGAYGIHPRPQEISQSHLDIEPIYEKPVDPVYSSPQFVHQDAVDDSTLGHPPSKIEQIAVDPKPTYDVVPIVQKVEQIPSEPVIVQQTHEPELPLEKDTPVIVPNPPIDQQVLVEPEEISQKTFDDKPDLSQVSIDVPPPKVLLVEPESPIVQQASVDVPPPRSDVKYIDDDVVVQLPLDGKPSVKTVVEPPVVQQVAEDYVDVPSAKPLSYSGDILHRSGDPLVQTTLDKYPSQTTYEHNPEQFYDGPPKYQFIPNGPPYEKISHSTEIIHGPPRGFHSDSYGSVKLPPPAPSTKSIAPPLPHQQEHIDVPLSPPPPPPPVTKSVVSIEPVHQQEHIDVPLSPPVSPSVKLPPPPPPPVTKSLAQEYVEVPQSVKLPPPPPPVTKTVVQEPVDVLLTKPPAPHSVKLPPPSGPVYKSPPIYKPVGGIKTHPYAKVPVARYPPVSHSVKQPYARSYYVKAPPVSQPPLSYVPLTKSPVPYSVKRPYAYPPVSSNPRLHYGNPHVKSPYPRTPVTKTFPISHGVKHPVGSYPHSVKYPKPIAGVKSYPSVKLPPAAPHFAQSTYADEPLPYSPISHSVKHPHNTASVKGYPSVKLPPATPHLDQSTYVDEPQPLSPVPHSVKHPHNTGSVKGYPSVKLPPVTPHLDQSTYVDEPQPLSPVPHSVKHPHNTGSVKGYPSVKLPPSTPHLDQSAYVDEQSPVPHSIKHPHNTAPAISHDSHTGYPHSKNPPPPGAPLKKYLPVGHSAEAPYFEPKEELYLSAPPPEIPHPAEENSPLEKYPQVSHAFQISPPIPPPGPRPESSVSISDGKSLDTAADGPSPFDKYPRVSHAVRLPGPPKPTTTSVPNLFAAVPLPPEDGDDDASIESPLSGKEPVSHSVLLPSPILEPKVSALRSDALSGHVSQPVRQGARQNRVTYGEPKQDFPAFPAESAYGYPDPVSDKVSNSFKPRRGYGNSRYEPEESESSNSPSVEEAKSEINRVSKEIGGSFGDRISRRSRLS